MASNREDSDFVCRHAAHAAFGPTVCPVCNPSDPAEFPESLRVNNHSTRGPWPEVKRGPGPSLEDLKAPNDAVVVGDLGSQARGSGARKNAGKFEWHQLPWFALDEIEDEDMFPRVVTAYDIISMLGEWQQKTTRMIEIVAAMLQYIQQTTKVDGSSSPNLRALEQTVRVLEFGAKKYAVGNWAKGMPWSVCFSCAMSHLTSITKGEEYDAESGLPHSAHAMCNLLFLRAYETLYREGDDRIPQFKPSDADLTEAGGVDVILRAYETLYREGDDRIPQFKPSDADLTEAGGVDVITGDHA